MLSPFNHGQNIQRSLKAEHMAKVSGFSIIRNASLMNYPVIESVMSLLPFVDEYVVGIGQSEDDTRAKFEDIQSPKLRLFDTVWDTGKTSGGLILSEKTNEALSHCKNNWCFYLQADEVFHEDDWPKVIEAINKAEKDPDIEGILFDYLHFYGSYDIVATARNWYRREVRIVRRDTGIQSHGDAQSFRIRGRKPRVLYSRARIFHYGWVKPPGAMGQKNKLLSRWWHGTARDNDFNDFQFRQQYGLRRFRGTHPAVMQARVNQQDWKFEPNKDRWLYSLKDYNHLFSDLLERATGWRIGEYKSYTIKNSL